MKLSNHLHHVAVRVANLDASIAWYVDHLDFTFERSFRLDEAGIEIVYLTTPAVRLELIKRDTDGAEEGRTGLNSGDQPMHICFEVSDIEVAAQELRHRGVEFAQEPRLIEPALLKNCWIKDVEDNLIEFVERT